jgi:hypothetical protein
VVDGVILELGHVAGHVDGGQTRTSWADGTGRA